MITNLSEPMIQSDLTVNETIHFMLKNSSNWTDENLKFTTLKSLLVLAKDARDLASEVHLDPARMRLLAKQIIFLWKLNEKVKLQVRYFSAHLLQIKHKCIF